MMKDLGTISSRWLKEPNICSRRLKSPWCEEQCVCKSPFLLQLEVAAPDLQLDVRQTDLAAAIMTTALTTPRHLFQALLIHIVFTASL